MPGQELWSCERACSALPCASVRSVFHASGLAMAAALASSAVQLFSLFSLCSLCSLLLFSKILLEAQQVQLSDFELGRTLGCGSFGRVKFAKYKPEGQFYAVKPGAEPEPNALSLLFSLSCFSLSSLF